MKLRYTVTDEIRELGLRSIVVAEVTGIKIKPSHPELDAEKARAADVALRLTPEALDQNPILSGYRELVRRVGRSPAKFPPAAQSLIKTVRRLGRFPQVNCAVDAYNLVAVRRFLALGAHDMAKIGTEISFRVCRQPEPFVPLGGGKPKNTQPGDYVYADEKQVLAWLDSRDCDAAKWSASTVDALIVIQGTDLTTPEYNLEAAQEACNLVTRYCGGDHRIRLLD